VPSPSGSESVCGVGVSGAVRLEPSPEGKKSGAWWWIDSVRTLGLDGGTVMKASATPGEPRTKRVSACPGRDWLASEADRAPSP